MSSLPLSHVECDIGHSCNFPGDLVTVFDWAHPRRSACQNNVALFQGEIGRNEAQQVRNAKYHIVRRTLRHNDNVLVGAINEVVSTILRNTFLKSVFPYLLSQLVVDFTLQFNLMGVGYLIFGDEVP